MTIQIDSLAIGAEVQNANNEAHIDQLFEQIDKLDHDILDAVAHRTELARTLAAATRASTAAASDEDPSAFDELGNDGSVIARLLTRLARGVR